MELIKSLLSSDPGSFAFVAILMLSLITGTYYVTKFIEQFKAAKEANLNEIDNFKALNEERLKLERQHTDDTLVFLKERIVENSLRFQKDFYEIKGDIASVKSNLELAKIMKGTKFFKSQSPLKLTPLGVKVADDIKAESIINNNWDRLFNLLEQEIRDKNPYDIQQYCMNELIANPSKFIDDATLLDLKDYAFSHGEQLSLYLGIFGLIIRDRYFKSKGINIDDIDKHDPSKKEDN